MMLIKIILVKRLKKPKKINDCVINDKIIVFNNQFVFFFIIKKLA